jgi:hypothetical protein
MEPGSYGYGCDPQKTVRGRYEGGMAGPSDVRRAAGVTCGRKFASAFALVGAVSCILILVR